MGDEMKIRCGTDIIEIDRVKESIEKYGDKFLNRVYTDSERAYCETKNEQRYQHYAARFAAKEAGLKAVSELLKSKFDLEWKDIEIINQITGKPEIKIKKIDMQKIEDIDISMSHSKEYAIANVTVLIK